MLRIRRCSALVLCLIPGGMLRAQARPGLTIDDLQTLKAPGYMQLSPDGGQLAYTVGDRLLLVSTRAPNSPRQLGKGSLPTWSPDGKRLAWYSSESGTQQFMVMDVQSGHSERVTNLKGGIKPDTRTRVGGWSGDPQRYSWSPDGARLVFASQVEAPDGRSENAVSAAAPGGDAKSGAPLVLTTKTPPAWTLNGIFTSAFGPPAPASATDKPTPLPPAMVNQLFIVDLSRSDVRQLTTDASVYFNPAFSPDGRTIACASSEGHNPWTGPHNLYAIDVATGRKSPLTTGAGDKRLPRWSPDGKWIAYTGGEHFGTQSVFVIPANGGEPINVASKVGRYIAEFEWLPDSRSLAMLDRDGVNWPIVRVSVPDGAPEPLTGDAAAMRQSLTVSHNGTLAWAQNDESHYGVILRLPPGAAAASVLVDLNPQMRHWELGTQEVVRWKNSRGDRLDGVLIKPVGFRAGQKYPLIVDGYPSQPNGFKGNLMLGNQMWASKGYAVFWPNARAPHTWMDPYREEGFGQAGKGPGGWDVMVDDVTSGVDDLIRRGIADPGRMGLYGFSNGGGVVNYLVTRTSRFQCAVSVGGVYPDWLLPTFLHTDATIPTFEGGTSPWDDPAAYVQLSAVFHLKAVTTPMLLAAGDNDGDFLLGTIELYNGLRWLGKDVTFLRYPGQGHGFSGAALQDFWERETLFFDHHLKPEPRPN